MGTDRYDWAKGPCPCGKGVITVDRCSPDHGWGSISHWYEARIECDVCQTTHSIFEVPGEPPKLVLKSAVAKREAAVAAWHAKRTEIEATHEYNDAKSKIDQAVSLQKSMAAKHRVLVSAGLSDRSLPSFRKHPTYVISASRVAEACKRLGFPSQALDDMTAELEVHWQQGRFDPPAIATGIKGLEK